MIFFAKEMHEEQTNRHMCVVGSQMDESETFGEFPTTYRIFQLDEKWKVSRVVCKEKQFLSLYLMKMQIMRECVL